MHMNTLVSRLHNVSKLARQPPCFQVLTGWDKVSNSRVRPLGGECRPKKKCIITVEQGGVEIQRNAVNRVAYTLLQTKRVQCPEI